MDTLNALLESTSRPSYILPDGDFGKYLPGVWKRTLDWRHFGGSFDHIHCSNNIVFIDDDRRHQTESSCTLKWSFGKTPDKTRLQAGYVMKCSKHGSSLDRKLEWEYDGCLCSGTFHASTSTAVLHYQLPDSTVLVTYRLVDQHTMALCIVEVTAQYPPSIQYGHMSRLDLSLYPSQRGDIASLSA
eukprot:GILJ01005394.1.p1 GENE.GILJ01005394.1~~GILJ01005394.1.p1  ORF type:complete len:200 (-),score=14.10 GILJ01005394.1:342-899(-)